MLEQCGPAVPDELAELLVSGGVVPDAVLEPCIVHHAYVKCSRVAVGCWSAERVLTK